MFYAERGNRVVEIREDAIKRYAEQGYKITDSSGAVLVDTVPTDLATLTLEYRKRLAELKATKSQLENALAEASKLKAEIASLKATKVEATTKQSVPEVEPVKTTTKARKTKAE